MDECVRMSETILQINEIEQNKSCINIFRIYLFDFATELIKINNTKLIR